MVKTAESFPSCIINNKASEQLIGTAAVTGFSTPGNGDPLMPYYLFVFTGSTFGYSKMLKHTVKRKTGDNHAKTTFSTMTPAPVY